MPRNSIYLETTDVAPEKSAGEITAELVKAGAREISTQYGTEGKVTGMRWAMPVGRQMVYFAMPAKVDAVFKILRKRVTGYFNTQAEAKLRAKAERIAWRQLFRWTQAQNAMIQTGMAEPAEIFMAYAVAPGSSQTMFQAWTSQLALPPAQERPQ